MKKSKGSPFTEFSREDPNYLSFLIKCSEAIWKETTDKGILKFFKGTLKNFFHFDPVQPFKVSIIEGQKPLFDETHNETNEIKIEGVERILDFLAQEMKHFIEVGNHEKLKGVHPLFCQGRNFYFVILGDLKQKSYLILWENSRSKKALTLDYLVRQVQHRYDALVKLDHTQSLVYIDDLTGLFNYRFLENTLKNEIKRAQRYHMSFSLLFIDLDNFKQINDRYGHLNGSYTLKKTADLLKESLREVDVVIRYGGDEYVVLLLGTTSGSAHIAAERIRKKIQTHDFVFGQDKVKITASIGISSFPEHGRDPKILLKLSDEAMYKSKFDGKNLTRTTEALPLANRLLLSGKTENQDRM